MAHQEDTRTIEVVNEVCCGLDVHKKKVSACLLYTDDEGVERTRVKEFGTLTDQLGELRTWLLDHDCPVVAMESTGVYWRPVMNVLEGSACVLLVNARHFRNVPGQKTDLKDSRWLAGLLRYGLLRGSFIPTQEVRDWRDNVRLRKTYVEAVGHWKQRVHKLLESANIKIDSIASDLFGVSGRNLMDLLSRKPAAKITPEEVADCLKGRLKTKADELCRAMRGFFRKHHRDLLKTLLRTIGQQEKEIARIDQRLAKLTRAHQDLLDRLDETPGVDQTAARAILAYLGPDLATFPTAAHLASWCGVCPGNHESAGKRIKGKSGVRGHALKSLLVEIAWAAVKTKNSYYREKYFRLKARRGAKRAILAIAHRLLKAFFHIIKHQVRFKELGEEYLMEINREAGLKRLALQARKLGYTLTPIQA